MAGYIVARVRVTDPEKYRNYTALTPAAAAAHDGVFIVRGGETTTLEGPEETHRVVVIRFPSVAKAKAFWQSAEYRAARQERLGAAEMSAIVIEGS